MCDGKLLQCGGCIQGGNLFTLSIGVRAYPKQRRAAQRENVVR
jgi:hypothetical protein